MNNEVKHEQDFTNAPHPYVIGRNYFCRTISHIDVGRLIAIYDRELILVDASWIADTGRYSTAHQTGSLAEVEPYPDGVEVIVNRDSLVDCCIWTHSLPREVL